MSNMHVYILCFKPACSCITGNHKPYSWGVMLMAGRSSFFACPNLITINEKEFQSIQRMLDSDQLRPITEYSWRGCTQDGWCVIASHLLERKYLLASNHATRSIGAPITYKADLVLLKAFRSTLQPETQEEQEPIALPIPFPFVVCEPLRAHKPSAPKQEVTDMRVREKTRIASSPVWAEARAFLRAGRHIPRAKDLDVKRDPPPTHWPLTEAQK